MIECNDRKLQKSGVRRKEKFVEGKSRKRRRNVAFSKMPFEVVGYFSRYRRVILEGVLWKWQPEQSEKVKITRKTLHRFNVIIREDISLREGGGLGETSGANVPTLQINVATWQI
ncbi:uncharacterized protein LOC143905622 [Temnothorax americanus]|uniref:uncharacterized protein LOC143905622 n=1 Tax=Temnothorax americanus TaxID=1964332 RepID=UPI004068A0B7